MASIRNKTIDLLRCIGLFLVIAAHCDFPRWFYNLREFDVVLLVFVSGASFYLSFRDKHIRYTEYLKKRVFRLLIPVYTFLTLFFIIFFLLGRKFSLAVIIESYLLLSGGILFVWVYRIFLTTSILNPMWIRILKPEKTLIYFVGSILLLIINDGLNWLAVSYMSLTMSKVFQYVVIYTIAYSVISMEGMLWMQSDQNKRWIFIGTWTILFFGLFMFYRTFDLYDMKYPPKIYYISYGLMWSGLLYMAMEHISLKDKVFRIIKWISANTMTIYLWHIMFYYLLETFFIKLQNNGLLSYTIYLGGGVAFTLLLQIIKGKLRRADAV